MPTKHIGQPYDRSDARDKVLGRATYTAEHLVPDLLHGHVISSKIACGRITHLNTDHALKIPGVIAVLSHKTDFKTARFDLSYKDMDSPPGSPFRPFSTPEVKFAMQPIALVVAESTELARYAARLVEVTYEVDPHNTDLMGSLSESKAGKGLRAGVESPSNRGDFRAAYNKSEVQTSSDYLHPSQHHNPMEMHASIVHYHDEKSLTIYDKTQGVKNSQHYVTMAFGLRKKNVRVLSPFVGGAFGSGLRPQYQLFLATLAALELKRSVKVQLTRPQMFSFGHRPKTHQTVSLGASRDGKINAIFHHAVGETSRFEDYIENVATWAAKLYDAENVEQQYRIVPLDTYTPLDMRAPGGASGLYALECAMDELATELKMDPLDLRLKNYSEEDPSAGKPFSSKALKECFAQGSTRFGWDSRHQRTDTPYGKHRGSGMATGIWDALQFPTRAAATLASDLKLEIRIATADIGTGTYTIMKQIAAEELGLPTESVDAKLGDTDFPFAFIQGGSATAASVGSAVRKACRKVQKQLLKEAGKMKNSPFQHADIDDVVFEDGLLKRKDDPQMQTSLKQIFADRDIDQIDKKCTWTPNLLKQRKYSMNTHSAVFVEVEVDADVGFVSVERVVVAVAAGRILNPKTARSQILGGVVWGISMALHEESYMDNSLGRFINHDFANYHIPVNADIKDIEVIFVEEDDTVVNPLGVKGLGEIGLVGVPAAVANAVFDATGKRVRELPITPDKLFAEP
ncbi:xanthine dehydrogenase family protein molybdopterin-binding subunit [Pelagicoccus sp. SDUM812002]|uniref:xanthine dehydrogenase family protein molybdopterin-binding subunit n=1 Tax=Pelagicoccus sp. SDUM812002 TaxID=3041266 RepID=UPI00280CB38D|nr:xanthine dehydrogenase family protein molybdopterin-binding subunit [Pelagicoccus sp. SDUM812002]MDQ8186544.1 xanthine dehydrogenase family protein molybdopterin-binding subunit [Pelagicoccus sp. SDUM812002]